MLVNSLGCHGRAGGGSRCGRRSDARSCRNAGCFPLLRALLIHRLSIAFRRTPPRTCFVGTAAWHGSRSRLTHIRGRGQRRSACRFHACSLSRARASHSAIRAVRPRASNTRRHQEHAQANPNPWALPGSPQQSARQSPRHPPGPTIRQPQRLPVHHRQPHRNAPRQPMIRQARLWQAAPRLRQFADAKHLRPQPAADLVEQIRQRPIPRPLPRRPTRRPDLPQIRQVVLNDPRKLLHPSPSTAPRITGHATPSPTSMRDIRHRRPFPSYSESSPCAIGREPSTQLHGSGSTMVPSALVTTQLALPGSISRQCLILAVRMHFPSRT